MRVHPLVLVAPLLAGACGDQGPTPTAAGPVLPFAEGTVLSFVSGETGAPVPNATVTLSGQHLSADGSGRLALPASYDRGSFLDIQDPAFLDRQTLLREPGSLEFTLWPRESPTGLDPEFTRNVVYDGSTGSPRRMLRIRPGTSEAYVVPSRPIRDDSRAMAEVTSTVEMMTEITGGQVRFLVADEAPDGALSFDLVIDPGDTALQGAVAVAKRKLSGWSITGGTVVYVTLGTVRTSTTAHELGHMFGLGHSTDPGDLMTSGRYNRSGQRFSLREELAMRLMLQRLPGNETPDNDRGAQASSLRTLSAPAVAAVVCEG